MHQRDRHAALADGGGNAFHGAEPDVAAREDARDAGLEEVRVAVELPPPGGGHVGAREHVAAAVERDLGRQPRRLGIRSDEDEQAAGFEPGRLSGRGVADVDRLERCIAVRDDHLAPIEHADVRPGGELFDEVMRHALLERFAPVEDGHAPGVRGEEHRRLAG